MYDNCNNCNCKYQSELIIHLAFPLQIRDAVLLKYLEIRL